MGGLKRAKIDDFLRGHQCLFLPGCRPIRKLNRKNFINNQDFVKYLILNSVQTAIIAIVGLPPIQELRLDGSLRRPNQAGGMSELSALVVLRGFDAI
jgi:hypothetical protein